ncbi:19239_t:CDS:1, partial [Cetraspora pellucida]
HYQNENSILFNKNKELRQRIKNLEEQESKNTNSKELISQNIEIYEHRIRDITQAFNNNIDQIRYEKEYSEIKCKEWADYFSFI